MIKIQHENGCFKRVTWYHRRLKDRGVHFVLMTGTAPKAPQRWSKNIRSTEVGASLFGSPAFQASK